MTEVERNLSITLKKGFNPTDLRFKAYSKPEVRRTLEKIFFKKCAYCESKYEATQAMNVEHWRPKGGVLECGVLTRLGYYWLASDWENLFPTCNDCNQARTQEIPGQPNGLLGKANQFPLHDASPRAIRPGGEMHEIPLLLNPSIDNPLVYLVFKDDGRVEPAEHLTQPMILLKGEASINVYALSRRGLVNARKAHIKIIQAHIKKLHDVIEDVIRSPRDGVLKDRLKRYYEELFEYCKSDKPYTAVAIQMVDRFSRGTVEGRFCDRVLSHPSGQGPG